MAIKGVTPFYVVSTTRDGIRRTANLSEKEALATVTHAVRMGYVVSCRLMQKGDPIILGMKEEHVEPS
jgi:hypothetical protein